MGPKERLLERITTNVHNEKRPVEKMGQLNQATAYIRLDIPNMDRGALVEEIKKYMIKRIPVTFGFGVYDSIEYSHINGEIPFPDRRETQVKTEV